MDKDIIDLSFLNEFPPNSLLPDKGVVKYLIKPGEQTNQKPIQKGNKAYIKLEGRKIDGSALDPTKNPNEIRKIALFSDDYIEGLHIAVSSMQKNEVSWFKIEPKYHFFKNFDEKNRIITEDSAATINKKEPLLYKIELIDYKSNALDSMDFEGRIERFEESREKGKELFQKNNYEEAYAAYLKSISLLRNFPNNLKEILSEKQREQLKFFSNILYSNAALCKIKAKSWFEALKITEEGLKNSMDDVKLLYRKGQCLSGLHEFSKARQVFEKILEIQPENQEAKQQISLCEQREKSEKEIEKRKYVEIFKNLPDEERKEKLEKKQKEFCNENSEKNVENTSKTGETNDKKATNQKRITINDLEKGIIIDANDPENVLNEQTHEYDQEKD